MSSNSSPRPSGRVAAQRRSAKVERRCHLCDRSFTKTEHLQRHVRSHTKEKPFVCEICGRKYSRTDTLLRHQKDHLDESSTKSNFHRQEAVGHSNTSSSPGGHYDDQSSVQQPLPIDPQIATGEGYQRLPNNENDNEIEAYSSTGLHNDMTLMQFNYEAPDFNPEGPGQVEQMAFDLEAQFPSWLTDEDFHGGLFDTPLVTSMAELGPGWSLNARPLSKASNPQPVKSLKHLWFTNINEVNDSHPASGTQTPIPHHTEVDDDYRQTLRRRLEIRPLQQSLPSAEFLNLCVRSFFARFHPIFPIVHAPTFRPGRANSMLLLSICSIGSLFTGSTHAVRQGIEIFERLHKAVLANWERFISRGTEEAVAMVQTAIIGQTFGLLSGDPKHLAIVDAFHGTCISWARKCGAFANIPPIDPNIAEAAVEQKWREWARNEEYRRIVLGLYIHDAELANIFHHEPFLRHDKIIPVAAPHNVFMAPRAEEWHQLYRSESLNVHRPRVSLPLTSPDLTTYPLVPPTSHFTAYTLLQGITVSIVEQRCHGELPSQEVREVQSKLLAFHERFLNHASAWDADHLDMKILWHLAFMSLSADFDLLERAIGREGPGLSPEDLRQVTEWANSDQAKRCVVHGTLILKKLETMPLGFEPAIHVPRAMFRAGIAWYCYTRFGTDEGRTNPLSRETFDFPELKPLSVNPASLLFEANGYKQGRPTAIEANGALCSLTDFLQRIGHWEIARKFAAILGALIHNEADQT